MRYFGLLPAVLSATLAMGQTKSMSQGPHRMELTLERQVGKDWKAVDPGFVFRKGDHVRFRFRTNFDGHLYVMNHGTGGSYTRLFPREDTGTENRIEAGREYLIPQTEGYFRVDGPAGHDVVYWVMAPIELTAEPKYHPLPPPPKPSAKLHESLRPRCDDAILRARGDCVDSSAGPKTVAGTQELPDNIKKMAGQDPGEVLIVKQETRSVVSSPAPLSGPVVYEFRLAHN